MGEFGILELFELFKNLGFSLFGGMIFWFSPFVLAFLWNKHKIKEIKSLVESLSPEEREILMKNQQEPILNRKHCLKQMGKILKMKQIGNRVNCTVLWYNESFPKLPSYENFHFSTVKPTEKECNQLNLRESTLVTLVIITNKSRRVVNTGFWLEIEP